jgi:hypothetical protein
MGGVYSGWIMPTPWEQNKGARNGCLQKLHHSLHVDSRSFRVEVRILDTRETAFTNYRFVVGAAWVGNVDETREKLPQELKPDIEGPSH